MESIMFCPNCNNTFDITKTVQQTGSGKIDYAKLVDQLLNQKEELDFKTINKEELLASKEYLSLDDEKRQFVSNKLLNMELNPHYDPTKNAAYFNCNNCGNIKRIKPGTLIYTKTSNEVSQNYISTNMGFMSDSKILPHTKNYICPNKACETHKNQRIKDAKMFKPNNSYGVKYICTICKTFF